MTNLPILSIVELRYSQLSGEHAGTFEDSTSLRLRDLGNCEAASVATRFELRPMQLHYLLDPANGRKVWKSDTAECSRLPYNLESAWIIHVPSPFKNV